MLIEPKMSRIFMVKIILIDLTRFSKMIAVVLFLTRIRQSYSNVLLLQNQVSKISNHWQVKKKDFLTQEKANPHLNRKVVIFIPNMLII